MAKIADKKSLMDTNITILAHIKLYSKLKLHYFPILQPGHFRAYSTENDTFDAKS
jgi:hypothetical protein